MRCVQFFVRRVEVTRPGALVPSRGQIFPASRVELPGCCVAARVSHVTVEISSVLPCVTPTLVGVRGAHWGFHTVVFVFAAGIQCPL